MFIMSARPLDISFLICQEYLKGVRRRLVLFASTFVSHSVIFFIYGSSYLVLADSLSTASLGFPSDASVAFLSSCHFHFR